MKRNNKIQNLTLRYNLNKIMSELRLGRSQEKSNEY